MRSVPHRALAMALAGALVTSVGVPTAASAATPAKAGAAKKAAAKKAKPGHKKVKRCVKVVKRTAKGKRHTCRLVVARASAAPAIPTGLKVVAVGDRKVQLDWNDNTGTFGRYQVYRDNVLVSNGPTVSEYTDTAVSNGQTYTYRVSAGTTGAYSGWTAAVSATPKAPVAPAVPTGLKVVSAADGRVELDWADNGDLGANHYQVYRDDALIADGPTESRFVDTGLTNGRSYTYRVGAGTSPLYSGWTSAVSAAVASTVVQPVVSAPTAAPQWSSTFTAYADGAKGPFAGWTDTPWNVYGGGSVSVVSDAVKGKALRSFGAANQYRDDGYLNQRAEQVPNLTVPGPGKTMWLAYDFKANADLGVSGKWQSFMQLKTGGAQDNLANLTVQAGGLGRDDMVITSGESTLQYSLGPIPRGTWTRLVFAIYASTTPGAGWVQVYRDGREVLPRTPWTSVNANGTRGSTVYPNGGASYLKVGLYRGPAAWNADWRYANFAMGTAQNQVM